ncbi:CGNR zinc finger domain-containing protein [Streptomyces sp. NPDC014623]|uniref:CGNR zinc finger domain-containing protein n=1 Tax=Streptomyces sp. NPDC014623 TaxID=3364875 RepID=UPI0036FABC92
MNERATAPGGLALIESLVNTLDIETGTDALGTPEGRAPFGLTGADVPGATLLREALRQVCLTHAGHRPPEGCGAPPLDRLLAAAPLRVTVDVTGAVALRPVAEPAGLTARVAVAVAEAAADGTWARLKACEADDCRWVYYDRSPAGRRRWCSMSVCGARAKMRRYRAGRGEGPA